MFCIFRIISRRKREVYLEGEIMKNDEGGSVSLIIGVILMSATIVLLSAVIAAVIAAVLVLPTYNATITVKEITQDGIMDASGNNYSIKYPGYDLDPFVVNRTYQIEYTNASGEKQIQRKHFLQDAGSMDIFNCIPNSTGPCK